MSGNRVPVALVGQRPEVLNRPVKPFLGGFCKPQSHPCLRPLAATALSEQLVPHGARCGNPTVDGAPSLLACYVSEPDLGGA